MKKSFFTLIILVSIVFSASAAQTFDTVILLDTSESMFPYFDSSVEYLIQDIIKNQLKAGDTFHLLTFADNPEYELSRKIRNKKDIEDILSRILLLQPLGRYTDLISALSYLNTYTNKLTPETLKKVIILTDGIHDPPPGADTYADKEILQEKIKNITDNMKRQGWDVSLVRFPLSPEGAAENGASDSAASGGSGTAVSSEGVDLFEQLSSGLDTKIIEYDSNNNALSHKATGAPQIIFPSDLGEVYGEFDIPFTVKNFSGEAVQVRLKEIIWNQKNILEKEVFLKIDADSEGVLNAGVSLPKDLTPGSYKIPLELVFSDDIRPYPRKGDLSFTLKAGSGGRIDWPQVLKILFYVLVVAAAVIVLILVIKYLSGKSFGAGSGVRVREGREHAKTGIAPERENDNRNKEVSAEGASKGRTSRSGKDITSVSNTSRVDRTVMKHDKHHMHGPDERAFEMVVQNQTRLVGMRNIHWFKDGSVRTLGGGSSDDYLIFIHPVQKRIAEIEMRGGKMYLKVLNKDYFSEISTSETELNGKSLKLISSDGKEFTVYFREWISPAERINRILHLIDKPGLPDFKY